MEQIKDANGTIIGHFKIVGVITEVYDKHMNYLGKSTPNGTFNKSNDRISPNQVPGLLLRG
jgi:hypothetical protein